MVARRPLGRNSWDQQEGSRHLAGIYPGQEMGESRFKGKIAKRLFNSQLFPRGVPVFTVNLWSFRSSPVIQIRISGRTQSFVLTGRWVGLVDPQRAGRLPRCYPRGLGPVVPAKSHKSRVLTCCSEGRVHSYFSCSALAPS